MIFRRSAVIMSMSIAAVTGCGTAPTGPSGRPLTIADAGPPPISPLQEMNAALRSRLKDPDSALVRIIGTPKAMVTNQVALVSNGGAGWRICAEVNGKNSYGGYVGYRRIFVLWNSGRILEYMDGDFGELACRGAESDS